MMHRIEVGDLSSAVLWKEGEKMLFSELVDKEVISIRDCKKLGHIDDLEFDCRRGCIEKVYIPEKGKLGNLFQNAPERSICFSDIKQIGPDVILVDIS